MLPIVNACSATSSPGKERPGDHLPVTEPEDLLPNLENELAIPFLIIEVPADSASWSTQAFPWACFLGEQ